MEGVFRDDVRGFGSKAAEVSGRNVQVRFTLISEVDATGSLSRRVTIGMVPDDVLLEIFGFYVKEAYGFLQTMNLKGVEVWCTLTHVCRRWRSVVLSSPLRLNLRLVCTSKTCSREMLYVWPTLPIVIEEWSHDDTQLLSEKKNDNIISALEHRNRICQISLGNLGPSQLDAFTESMQDPFPMLTHLELWSKFEPATAIPDSFLGGSSPLLQSLRFWNIPFPALTNLLLSTNHLVYLRLRQIPHSGYISPGSMVACLSSLTGLETLDLSFLSPRSHPGPSARHPSSFPRVDLPALTELYFHGVSEYIEEFVARINAPLLSHVRIAFFNQLVFDVSQLSRFIGGVDIFKAPCQSQVHFDDGFTFVKLSPFEDTVDRPRTLVFYIKCTPSEWQLSSLAQVCCSSLSSLQRSLESLDIAHFYTSPGHWHDDMENTQWLELLQPFIAVKGLYLFGELALPVAQALQELAGERATEVLPALQGIYIQSHHAPGAVREALEPFIAARQFSGYPVVVHHTERMPEYDGWYW